MCFAPAIYCGSSISEMIACALFCLSFQGSGCSSLCMPAASRSMLKKNKKLPCRKLLLRLPDLDLAKSACRGSKQYHG